MSSAVTKTHRSASRLARHNVSNLSGDGPVTFGPFTSLSLDRFEYLFGTGVSVATLLAQVWRTIEQRRVEAPLVGRTRM
jgi:hypothetical protein